MCPSPAVRPQESPFTSLSFLVYKTGMSPPASCRRVVTGLLKLGRAEQRDDSALEASRSVPGSGPASVPRSCSVHWLRHPQRPCPGYCVCSSPHGGQMSWGQIPVLYTLVPSLGAHQQRLPLSHPAGAPHTQRGALSLRQSHTKAGSLSMAFQSFQTGPTWPLAGRSPAKPAICSCVTIGGNEPHLLSGF